MKIAILGFGREGRAVLDFIKKSPKYDFAEIWALDKNPHCDIPADINKQTGDDYLKNLDRFNLIFRSPGVPYLTPAVQQALKNGAVVSSATKLFFEHCSSRIIGVTGTKGKGTTSTLLYQILKNSGMDAHLAGNIGRPALELLPHLKQHSLVVLELSSFQLHDLNVSPTVAVVLGIFPDHLDAHNNFKEYRDAKANITRHQTARDSVFYFRGDMQSARTARLGSGKKVSVAATTAPWFLAAELQVSGRHNFRNAAMAATVAKALGCPDEIIRETVIHFTGLEHRLELVRSLSISAITKQQVSVILRHQPKNLVTKKILRFAQNDKKKGKTPKNSIISFYNDSASTNPQTMLAAIQSFSEPTILIAGGYDKGLDYAPLAAGIRKTNTKLVVLFGGNKEKIKKALKRFPTLLCADLPAAVAAAVRYVREQSYPVSTIVFSPGAASFDMFNDYADRGRQFKKLVMDLTE